MRWVEGQISHCNRVLRRCHSERSSFLSEFGCCSFIIHSPWKVCFLLVMWNNLHIFVSHDWAEFYWTFHFQIQDIYFCLVTSCQLKYSPNSFMRTVSSMAKRVRALWISSWIEHNARSALSCRQTLFLDQQSANKCSRLGILKLKLTFLWLSFRWKLF